MLSTSEQQQVIGDLESMYGVHDVYFHKSKLYVINTYDMPDVDEYLTQCEYADRIRVACTSDTEHEYAFG